MDQFYAALTLFFSLLVEAMPFLLLGVLLSSSLLLFIDEGQLIAKLPKNPFLGAFVGSCAGFLFPVCECGNVPVARRLLTQGIPASVAVSFLLAAPTINPIVIWSTYVAFKDQPEIVIFRVIFSLGIATILGWVFSVQKDLSPLLQPILAQRIKWLNKRNSQGQKTKKLTDNISPLLQSGTFLLNNDGQPLAMEQLEDNLIGKKSFKPKMMVFLENLTQELRELGAILIFGSAIAAMIQVFVPREIILSLGQDEITSVVAMMILAAVVSICSTVDSFFALSFASTFTTGSILAFLVFGPMIDIKAIGLMLSIFKPKMLIYLFALAAQLTFILTLGYGYIF